MIPPPPLGDVVEVAEVELVLLARVGVDRHRHGRRRPEPRPTDVADARTTVGYEPAKPSARSLLNTDTANSRS
jgi:hypothetical protein